MSPRRSAADTRKTRTRIIDQAVVTASVTGLNGVTIGRLATDLGMSKAGVLGHFGTKESLQLATLASAVATFISRVMGGVADARPGLDRLHRLCEAWIRYLETNGTSPGGCLITAAATEFDARPGAVRDGVADAAQQWLDYLVRQVRRAVDTGELPPDTDADQVAFELHSIALGTNHIIQLFTDQTAGDRARRAMRRVLTPGQPDAPRDDTRSGERVSARPSGVTPPPPRPPVPPEPAATRTA